MTIAIYGSRQQQPYAAQIERILRHIVLTGTDIEMHPKLYGHLSELGVSLAGVGQAALSGPGQGCSLVLSIGGDGTFLRTAAWVGRLGIPVIGINTGHLGYLATMNIDDASSDNGIDGMLNADFAIEERTLLEVCSPEVRGWRYALNEVCIAKDDSVSMIQADTFVDGIELAQYRADGLIIATPTGSTAYNLSAGGPIVQPTAPVLVVSPIAAHSLGMRPLVIDDHSVLDINVSGRTRAFRLSLDGRSTVLPMGSEVRIRRAPFVCRIVMRPDSAFPVSLRRKLLFN